MRRHDRDKQKDNAMSDFAEKLDQHTVCFVRLLPGPIERVWDYLYDGRKRGEWFAAGPMPAKVGETFEMHFKHSDMSPHKAEPPEKMRAIDATGHHSTNRLLACEPPHRLVFTFGPSTHVGEASEVEMRLQQEGDKVRLTLTHSRIPDRGFMLAVSGGWHSHLDVLGYRLRDEVPPAFWDIWRQYDGAYDKRYA
jgi:uncharacterized protein YndB with AHSA1/START domain